MAKFLLTTCSTQRINLNQMKHIGRRKKQMYITKSKKEEKGKRKQRQNINIRKIEHENQKRSKHLSELFGYPCYFIRINTSFSIRHVCIFLE